LDRSFIHPDHSKIVGALQGEFGSSLTIPLGMNNHKNECVVACIEPQAHVQWPALASLDDFTGSGYLGMGRGETRIPFGYDVNADLLMEQFKKALFRVIPRSSVSNFSYILVGNPDNCYHPASQRQQFPPPRRVGCQYQ
jgi:hypothetical protein